MKKIFFYFVFIFFFLLSSVWAANKTVGEVLVLKAPLFRTPSLSAPVIQYVSKGDLIPIHPRYFQKDYHDENAFYLTLDRSGLESYIPKEYVKLVYEDEREFSDSAKRFDHDPTDYRLPEPLWPSYPLIDQSHSYRLLLALGSGTQDKETLPDPRFVEGSAYGNPIILSASFLKRISDDRLERFYFGGVFHLASVKNNFNLKNSASSTEESEKVTQKKTQIGLGPVVSYDSYRDEIQRVLIYAGFIYMIMDQQDFEVAGRTNTYYGTNIVPLAGALYQYKLGEGKVDLFTGGQMLFNLANKLNRIEDGISNDPSSSRPQWSGEVRKEMSVDANFLVGIQLHY